MIDKGKGTNTSSLVLGHSSSCPGPPHYLLQKNQQNTDHYQDPRQQQCSYNHTHHCQPHPQYHHNQVLPQQPRLPPQQPQQLVPQQNQQQNRYQLTLQPLPQHRFPQQNTAPQQPSTSATLAMPVWTSNTRQHYQQLNQHQQTLYQNTQHHHQPPQNTTKPTTSQHHHHRYQTQTQAASSPAEHLHPTVQEMAALVEEKARLEAHLRELRDRRRCVVCLDKDQGAVFMPCSHLVTCPSCAVTLATCPVCRTPVHYLLPVTID